MIRRLAAILAVSALCLGFSDLAAVQAAKPAEPTAPLACPPTCGDPSIVMAAGDLCSDPVLYPTDTTCNDVGSALLPGPPAAELILLLGDIQYNDGTLAKYQQRYAVSAYGTRKPINRPTVGNHEYQDPASPRGYQAWFEGSPNPVSVGWTGSSYHYSFDIGPPSGPALWHVASYDGNCGYVSSACTPAGEAAWLDADLAAHAAQCKIVMVHEPTFDSGHTYYPGFGSTARGQTLLPMWQTAYAHQVDLVLNGHDHLYERFNPQNIDPVTGDGIADPLGPRQITVGTGGNPGGYVFGPEPPLPNSVFRYDGGGNSKGILRLTLQQSFYSYTADFINYDTGTVIDSVTADCH
jgi:hypothetical protein